MLLPWALAWLIEAAHRVRLAWKKENQKEKILHVRVEEGRISIETMLTLSCLFIFLPTTVSCLELLGPASRGISSKTKWDFLDFGS